jgi:hypothetical protein
MYVVRGTLVAVRHQSVLPAYYEKLRGFDAGKGLKSRARRAPTLRAVAIYRVSKIIGDAVANRTA